MSRAEDRGGSAAGRRVAKNTMLLSMGQAVQLVSMGLWTILVARYVGPDVFGIFAYAQAALTILMILGSLGLDQLLTRDVAQRPEQGLRYLATFGAIRLLLTVTILVVAFVATRLGAYSADRRPIIMLVAMNVAVMGLNTLVTAMLSAHEAMHYAAIAQSANYLLTLASGAIAIWLRQPFALVLGLSLAASLAQLLMAVFFTGHLQRAAHPSLPSLIFPPSVTLDLLRVALPFTLLQLISTLRTYAPPLLLEYLTRDDAAVGYYAAAQRVNAVTVIIPDMLLMAIFPAFSSSYARERERFGAMFERAYRYVLLVTVPLALILWSVGPGLTAFLYGPQYVPAGRSLQVLSLALLGGVGWVMGPAMLAMGRERAYATIYIATMVAAGGLAVWAIPRYGSAGAAGALVAGKLLQDAVYTALLFRWLHVRFPAAWVGKTIVATLLMSLLSTILAPRVHLLALGLILAPAVYLASHIALRSLSADDWSYIRRLLPARIQNKLDRLAGRPSAVPEDDPSSRP